MSSTNPNAIIGMVQDTPLRKNRQFVMLLAGRTASAVANASTWVLLPISVYERTGSASLAGLMSATNVVPFIAFGLVAGAMVDRRPPAATMARVEMVNAAVLLVVPALVVADSLGVAALFAVGFLSATAYVWFDVASAAVVGPLVGPQRVYQANGYLWGVQTVVTAAAAPAAFLAVELIGLATTFAVLAAAGLLSAWCVSRVCLSAVAAPSTATSTLASIREGMAFLSQHSTIRTLTLIAAGSGISGGAIYGLIVVFADNSLGLTSSDQRVAWLIAASGAGAFAASLAAGRLRRLPLAKVVFMLLSADIVLMASYAVASSWVHAAIAISLWNAVHTMLMIVSISSRQVLCPPELQGRVNAAGRMVAWGSVPVGAAVGGLLTDALGESRVPTLLMIAPVMLSLLVATLALVPPAPLKTSRMGASLSFDQPEHP